MLVRITWWASEKEDWNWFYLLGVNGDKLWLKGADDQETGGRHIGDQFIADLCEIIELEYRG